VSIITIGGTERPLAVADRGWIGQAFDTQALSGRAPCVRVLIQASGVDMTLQTLTCAAGAAGGGRPPSREESEISRLWNMEGLSSMRYTADQVAAFVERVAQLLRC
jgi:hypothetical protein